MRAACSFCGAEQPQDPPAICDECLGVCCEAVEGQARFASSPCALSLDEEPPAGARCAFCGASRPEVERLFGGASAVICDRCVIAESAKWRT